MTNTEKTILERIIKNDIFCAVADGLNSFYISDCLASVLEIHSDSKIEYPVNTPAVWNRKYCCWLSDDPELMQAAAALAYMFNELEQLETK